LHPVSDLLDVLLLVAASMPAIALGLWGRFFFPAAGGLAFWWLRRRTGSLMFPIVAHNGANLATYAWAMLSTKH
jgi:membrane protease YdiL (CAAX protease family)